MEEQREKAAHADEYTRLELKKRGLLVKAEIPRGPSHLILDADRLLNDFGPFGKHMIIARKLLLENESIMRKKSGNDPKRVNRDLSVDERPGYLKTTHAQTI